MSKFVVSSPDGLDLAMGQTFKTRELAETAITDWVVRYERQGYYKAADGQRIPLSELPNHCTINPCPA